MFPASCIATAFCHGVIAVPILKNKFIKASMQLGRTKPFSRTLVFRKQTVFYSLTGVPLSEATRHAGKEQAKVESPAKAFKGISQLLTARL